MKLTNGEVNALMKSPKGVGLDKLMNHANLDSDKAYDLSLLVPELSKQFGVIEENRNRISKKIFPLNEETEVQEGFLKKDERTGKMMTNDGEEATPEQEAEFNKRIGEFTDEFNKVLEKEVEIEGDKIILSRKKDEKTGRSELQNLNLTVVDLMSLSPIITVMK